MPKIENSIPKIELKIGFFQHQFSFSFSSTTFQLFHKSFNKFQEILLTEPCPISHKPPHNKFKYSSRAAKLTSNKNDDDHINFSAAARALAYGMTAPLLACLPPAKIICTVYFIILCAFENYFCIKDSTDSLIHPRWFPRFNN